jgi:sialate O-acetylesterase
MEGWTAPRVYKVPAAVVVAGRNVIAIRVLDTAGAGGITGQAAQMRVFPADDEAAAVPLAGPWRMQASAALAAVQPVPSAGANNPNVSTVLYNGMIAPLLPYAIKGAIWYQGESNAGRAYQYRALLPALIHDWRKQFGVGDFGFHIVSLANFLAVCPTPRDNEWAELREAQAFTAGALPNCGVAMAIDIGDAADIHPRNKQEVGRRLALSALATTYGQAVEGSGPTYRALKVVDAAIHLSFDHVGGGLVAKGDKLTGFAIAEALPPGVAGAPAPRPTFVWADAVIRGDTIVVSSPQVTRPAAVRYGWDANPVCNLYNRAGLPAVPFRTDDWPGLTAGRK